jgi:protein-tyrosine phosphatase
MDWILDNVAVGSWRDAANKTLLSAGKINAILNVRSDDGDPAKKEANETEEQYCIANSIAYCFLPVNDFSPAEIDQLIHGVAFIEKNVKLERRVLVHCGAGLGRSPSFVAAYLIFKGYSVEEAINIKG